MYYPAIFLGSFLIGGLLRVHLDWTPAEEPPPKKPVVVVFTASWCGPCQRFKKDMAKGEFPDHEFQAVTWDDGQWDKPEMEKAFRAATKHRGQILLPTFWEVDEDDADVGYTTPQDLLDRLSD